MIFDIADNNEDFTEYQGKNQQYQRQITSDQAKPNNELWYFTRRSFIARVGIKSRYSLILLYSLLNCTPGL